MREENLEVREVERRMKGKRWRKEDTERRIEDEGVKGRGEKARE